MMQTIVYTSQAKDDLAKINWKTRERIINILADIKGKQKKGISLKAISSDGLHKLTVDEHVVIGELEGDNLNILNVQKKQLVRVPD
ncbi:MAG: hypothetical protein ACE5DX_01015 [Candidatus Dojkabacteria bacterium]